MNISDIYTYLESIVRQHNSLLAYTKAVGVMLMCLGIYRLIRKKLCAIGEKRAKKTETRMDDILISAISNLPSSAGLVLSIYLGIQKLSVNPSLDQVISIAFVCIFISQIGLMLVRMVKGFMEQLPHHEENPQTTMLISMIAKIAVRVTVILLILNNLGVEITALVTSLGVIGIATGLALQNVLEDLFSSISIHLDKPFSVGDYIQIGDEMGTVKSVGLKTTRLDTIRGEEIVLTNRKLTNETLRNYGVMDHRTITDIVVLDQETDLDVINHFGDIITDIVKDIEIINFQRCILEKIDHQGYHLEFRYTISSQNYITYRQLHEKIMLDISRYLKTHGIRRGISRQEVVVVGQEESVPDTLSTLKNLGK